MKIKPNTMTRTIYLFLSLLITAFTVNAQKGINFSRNYAAGGKMLMNIDSSSKNVFYSLGFPNQPFTAFNFLPEVHNVSIQINFKKNIIIQDYRYTILVENKPIVLNRSIDMAQLKDTHAGGDEEIFRSTTFGIFPIKNKIVTIISYDIKTPQDVYKTIFYGKPIPRAKIKYLSKRFKTDKGVDYTYITNPKYKEPLIFTEKDDEITIYKDRSELDYLYKLSIRDKHTNKTIFESTTWLYGGMYDETGSLPEINVEKNIFKKSGDYEIIIQPSINWKNCLSCDITSEQIEEYISRYTLSITLDEENYTKKELFIYSLIAAFTVGLAFLIILYFIKKRNKKTLAENEQQKNIAKLQLTSIRSQLNPHFLFNALSGIQNLMNKNETDNANKYLAKFARLTRNVLDDKELISLLQEKTLLDDYLQMEQLRFGFKYKIISSENLDLANIEIPSMLLQPFVENAVKHGISQKANNGKIMITFIRQETDLVLNVTDNGNGFDTHKKTKGLGLPLSDSRIALLNSIYKENRFTLNIQSSTTGTEISLTLTDWL